MVRLGIHGGLLYRAGKTIGYTQLYPGEGRGGCVVSEGELRPQIYC
jgi:hypothetical protein